MFGNLFLGRNGIDRYSLFLGIFSVMFFPYPYLWILGIGLLGYAVFRAFSKKLENRKKELTQFDAINRAVAGFILKIFYWFRKIFRKIGASFSKTKTRMSQKKQYLFIKCPQCKKLLRLPRKKGRLQATCPLCKAEFIKKT